MRLLFSLDAKDYDPGGTSWVRPSVRAVILRAGRVAMVHSRKYDYYKFPGGGLEAGESHAAALVRETLEEAGLAVKPETIRAYGYVHRVQKGQREDMFIQDNYYYFCEAAQAVQPQKLDDYEADEQFTLAWIDPHTAIQVNLDGFHGPKDQQMLVREARVLQLLLEDGHLR